MKYIFILIFVSSCSIAPFSTTTSGRSAGAGNFQAEVGNVNNQFNLKLSTGVSPNFDIGLVMEFGTLSTSALVLKYSLLNNETGPSTAIEFGYGSSETTTFYYAGLIASLAFSKQFELFIAPRINQVQTDETDIELNKDYGNFRITELDVTYLQLTYGFNLFISEDIGVSLYSVYFKGDNVETLSDQTFGANFIFKY